MSVYAYRNSIRQFIKYLECLRVELPDRIIDKVIARSFRAWSPGERECASRFVHRFFEKRRKNKGVEQWT